MSTRLAIPRTVRIDGERWRVRMVPRLKRDRGYVGFMDQDAREILIDPGLSREEQERTFVHEVLHALWPEDVCGSKLEERLICELEWPLHRFITSLRAAGRG